MMPTQSPHRFGLSVAAIVAVLFASTAQAQFVPGSVESSTTVKRIVDDKFTSDAEKAQLRLFHGLWDQLDEAQRATPEYKLATWRLDDPDVTDKNTDAYVRAVAAFRRGDYQLIEGMLAKDDSPKARLLRGQAFEGLGKWAEAVEMLKPLRDAAHNRELAGAEDMVAAAGAIALLCDLQGSGAHEYKFLMDLLGESREADRLYYPRLLVEAKLLAEKDNPQEAVKTLHEALKLNPRSSEAWDRLGRLAMRTFDFAGTNTAVMKLRSINPDHPLADALEAESLVKQKDTPGADAILVKGLTRWPNHRQMLAAVAASAALQYDDEARDAALAQFDKVSPGHPLAYYVMGSYLSFARQYPEAEAALGKAVSMQPNWSVPQLELGLLFNQYGKDLEGITVLRRVVQMDPFNKRAKNVLKLLEDLVGYETLETDHFIIRWREPIDAALAGDMAPVLETYYKEIGDDYKHYVPRKTLIEIMPNKQYFAVRITGMPDIWTIGAATGPIVAITPPRIGKKQSGPFDWQRVMRHEFSHTVTLSATDNRMPHWFTEAAAVAQEPGNRSYETYQLLANTYKAGELFNLDTVNWGFVRPKKPTDRQLAYAQSHWMYEHIVEKYGHAAILRILDESKDGTPLPLIVPNAVGVSSEEFMSTFLEWAGAQVKAWGMNPEPSSDELKKLFEAAGTEDQKLAKRLELLEKHPDHPDLLKLVARDALKEKDDAEAVRLLEQYRKARPVDPWASHQLAEIALRQGRKKDALPHLSTINKLDQKHGNFAQQIAEINEELGQLDEAQVAAEHALVRTPYDGTRREYAAKIALKRGDLKRAHHHLMSMTLIEPKYWKHYLRLAAIEKKMGNDDAAHEAALKAREINKDAPVDKFLKSE